MISPLDSMTTVARVPSRASGGRVWVHVGSLMQWRRAAVGIVRVECEYARWLLATGDPAVEFCAFDRHIQAFRRLSPESVAARVTAVMAGVADDPAPFDGAVVTFTPGDRFVSLGLDWETLDHRCLWTHKAAGLHVTLMCYDLIPVIRPQWFAGVHTPERFATYLADLCWCADQVLCISQHTRRDLEVFTQDKGIPMPSVAVVRLGDPDPREWLAGNQERPSAPLALLIATDRARGQPARPFVLYVSTIERRKNHEVLYRSWARLREQAIGTGDGFVPHRLVCVGMAGWGVSDLLKDIELDPRTRDDIVMLHQVSDAELAWLYRHCAFTVYPSLYEGWGLPVAESLAWGKFCLCSSAASIPEVGGDLCEYLDPWDLPAWADRLGDLMRRPQAVSQRHQRVALGHRPYVWARAAQHIHERVRGDTLAP